VIDRLSPWLIARSLPGDLELTWVFPCLPPCPSRSCHPRTRPRCCAQQRGGHADRILPIRCGSHRPCQL